MDHQLCVTYKIAKPLTDLGKNRLVFQCNFTLFCRARGFQQVRADAVYTKRFFRHGPFGVDVDMIGLTRGHMVPQLDRADLDNPVAAFGIKARGFGIEYNLTHLPSPPESA